MKPVTYTDKDGILRRVLMPDHALDDSPETGIPISVDLSGIHPNYTIVELQNRLFERGLIQPDDFEKPGANDIIMQVLRSLLRLDVAEIVSYVRKQKG